MPILTAMVQMATWVDGNLYQENCAGGKWSNVTMYHAAYLIRLTRDCPNIMTECLMIMVDLQKMCVVTFAIHLLV